MLKWTCPRLDSNTVEVMLRKTGGFDQLEMLISDNRAGDLQIRASMEGIRRRIGGDDGIKETALSQTVSLLLAHFATEAELEDVTMESLNTIPGLSLGQKNTIVRKCKSGKTPFFPFPHL